MPRIVERKTYGGAERRIERLHLAGLWQELEQVLTGFALFVEERKDANGAAAVRRLLDERFQSIGGWEKTTSGGIDWRKCDHNKAAHCLGVEIQVSGRSDLMIVDVDHLREAIVIGEIDVGVLVTASNRLAPFLTDRVGRFSDATRAVERARASDLPIVVLGLDHDGPGPALQKAITRTGKKKPPGP